MCHTYNEQVMKRNREDDPEETVKRVKESDVSVLTDLNDKYSQIGSDVNDELKKAREQYLVSYLKKVIEKLPLSKQVIDVTAEVSDGPEGFLKMYSIAKTVVHSEAQLRTMVAFNSVFDMLNGLVGKFLHDKFIKPHLEQYLTEEQLQLAISSYQDVLNQQDENEKSSMELHCVAYLIQTELEKKEMLKVPNPMFSRITKQINAVSKYITCLLMSIAMPKGNRELWTESPPEIL